MLRALKDPKIWERFRDYKIAGGHMSKRTASELDELLRTGSYLPVVDGICRGASFPPPRKSEISKLHSNKKRIVYTYPTAENWVLKLLTYLLQRKYDGIFADNLYSFRPGKGVHDGVKKLAYNREIKKHWCYKADIHNYFNSVPVKKILPILKEVLGEDPEVYDFLEGLLSDPWVEENGQPIAETKGIMAGTPISSFLANLYLAYIDHYFADQKILYVRYSDDIILFHETKEDLDRAVAQLHRFLDERGLSINPGKELYTPPGEMWTFLGFSYHEGVVDVAPVSVEKLKAKMRRKARALLRWKAHKGATGEQAAKAFVRVFNRKLFENTAEHELTWSLWYFPMINTTRSLQAIDNYCQSCIRYIATGKRNKGAYRFTYDQIKSLGYISLVNRYYKRSEQEADTVK